MRLMAVDQTALALGLAPGLMLADARARVPDLEVAAHDSRDDQDRLERMLDGCIHYTPPVALVAPVGFTLHFTGCATLFGGAGTLSPKGGLVGKGVCSTFKLRGYAYM